MTATLARRVPYRLGARDVPAKRVAGGTPITQLYVWLGLPLSGARRLTQAAAGIQVAQLTGPPPLRRAEDGLSSSPAAIEPTVDRRGHAGIAEIVGDGQRLAPQLVRRLVTACGSG